MLLKNDSNLKKKQLNFCLKYDMRNLVNFNAASGKAENFHFDGLLSSKVCNVWAKKIQRNCVIKNELRFQKWHKEFDGQVVESKVEKFSVYNVLVEGMYFLEKSSSSNFNFLDFPLLVWSCSNSSSNFWNRKSIFV